MTEEEDSDYILSSDEESTFEDMNYEFAFAIPRYLFCYFF
jgi:hypothetical protein